MRRQKRRPSEGETRHPLQTFQSCLMSSLLEGSRIVSSCRPRGKSPGRRPTGIGD
jgi:hypothetical protein